MGVAVLCGLYDEWDRHQMLLAALLHKRPPSGDIGRDIDDGEDE